MSMVEFKLPEIGEGVIEGEIVQWLIGPGRAFAANDALVEVMTDKATIEVPAPFDGAMVEHRAAEGDVCAVGSVIAMLSKGAVQAGASASVGSRTGSGAGSAPVASVAAPASPVATRTDANILATPAARALAREHDIDLGRVPVDERGRITKRDVVQAHERGIPEPAPAVTPTAPAVTPAAARAPAAAVTPAVQSPAPAPAPTSIRRPAVTEREDQTIPFRGMRRRIAEGMVRSYTTAVHYTYVEQIDVTRLVELRSQAKAAAEQQGVSLSYLPFIIKAVCHALKRYPIVNAELDEPNARIIVKQRYHIGVAAATPQGLMVPVIHDADTLSLLDIAREVARLGEGAKNGKLSREELSGSTFSITSLGSIGGVLATPILNFPEVGILGVHAIRKVPIVTEDDQIGIGHIMNLSVSFDHRVVDGFEGASFLQEVRRFLEDPTLLLLAGI
jgi:pyruvate dehydrogenase E2 component (dihydrolipoamide acetyltransferase)